VAVQASGTVLAGRYRVIRRLGTGGAATVFLCEDERLGRKVAVKRMHAHSPENIAERLRREARLGASLSHPNLVSVFDTETYEEGVLIVMEYVEGETLADALARGPLETRRAIEVIRELASALDHVHAQGIVHRDVKPANVLLGVDGSVKLADLGVGLATDLTRITQSGQVLGTPAYMSPEQIDGATPAPAGDIYALGAVAYEVLTGRKARKGKTPLEVAHRVTTEPPPDLRRLWPDAPPAAAEAIKRAMARDPARRPASAGEFAAGLSSGLSGTQTTVTQILSAPPPVRRRRLPSWWPFLAIAVGAAALLVALNGEGGSGSKPGSTHRTHHRRHHGTTPKSPPAPAQTNANTTTGSTTQSPSALNDQGKALIDAGRAADAIPVLQRALAAFPAAERGSIVYGWTLFNLGDAYLRTGQPDKAIPYLEARLRYPGQIDVVRAELQQAQEAAGLAPAGGKHDKGKHKGNGKGG
jgi:serine/threonine-protein kinase